MSPVVAARRSGYPVTPAAVDEILDTLNASVAGQKVLVKPNCLMAAHPDQGVTTHPSLVASLVASLKKRGARVRVGDNPGAKGYGATERCFRAAGLYEAAGDCYVDLGQDTVREPIRSRFLDSVVVSRAVLEADVVISVPKLKTHCMTLLTGAVKNMYGMLAGAEKVRLHALAKSRADFSEVLVDVYGMRPPDLAVMDAVVVMEGDGPSHGSLRKADLLLASDNAVAIDAAAARLVGVEPQKIQHLAMASHRGYGPLGKEEADLSGRLGRLKDFDLPSPFRLGLMNIIANRVVFSVLSRSRLQVERSECTGCGECAEACPAGAMMETPDGYQVDSRLCHQCYCCHELCPSGAVKVRGAMATFMRRGSTSGRQMGKENP